MKSASVTARLSALEKRGGGPEGGISSWDLWRAFRSRQWEMHAHKIAVSDWGSEQMNRLFQDGTNAEKERWVSLLENIIDHHDYEGRPLALPDESIRALLENPDARFSLSDCEGCGLLVPAHFVGRAAFETPLLATCPLCAGAVDRCGYIGAHGHRYPNGRVATGGRPKGYLEGLAGQALAAEGGGNLERGAKLYLARLKAEKEEERA